MSYKHRASSLDSSLSSASTTELEARKAVASTRLLELEDEEVEDTDNGMPSPHSISVVMDEYVSASFVGRSSYASGDLLSAVTQFNEALGIELQTELDCLYDTNLGLVSGLVRREVQSRVSDSPVHSADKSCRNILSQLANVYVGASTESDKHPTKSKWYLKMGAALCVINEWEKAKQVYKEGINMCRDKKELKTALKNLIKLEQITSFGDIPVEDRVHPAISSSQQQSPMSPASPRTQTQPTPKSLDSPKTSRRKSLSKVLRKRSKSLTNESIKSKNRANKSKRSMDEIDTDLISDAVQHPHTNRSISIDVIPNEHLRLSRVSSSQLPSSGTSKIEEPSRKNSDPSNVSPLALSDGVILLRDKKGRKSAVKRNSIGLLFGRHTPTLSSEEKQLWTECFAPNSCVVTSNQSMTTSAVAHMRQLAVEPIKRENRPCVYSKEQQDSQLATPKRITFEAAPIKCMTIDSDDSELEDN